MLSDGLGGWGRGVKLLWVLAYRGGRVALERQRKEIGGNAKDHTRGQLMRSLAFRVAWGLGGGGTAEGTRGECEQPHAWTVDAFSCIQGGVG